MKKNIVLLALFALVLALAPAAQAAPIVVPGDGYTGAYRLAFITTGGANSTLMQSETIGAYNSFVDTAGDTVLASDWKVIGSTGAGHSGGGDSVDARDNTGTNPSGATDVRIYTLNGVKIADNYTDLWDGTLDTVMTFQDGTAATPGSPRIFTGTNTDGTASSFYFGRTTNNSSVTRSKMNYTWNWISDGASGSWDNYPLMGMSSVITASTPTDLYWEGSTGEWDDQNAPIENKWSTTVNGTEHLAPTSGNNMIIDDDDGDSVVTVTADFASGGTGPAATVSVGANNTSELVVGSTFTLEATGAVTIGASGTLSGGGTVEGSQVDVSGTLAPGDSIGTLTVEGGALTMNAGSSMAVEIKGNRDGGSNVAGTNNDSVAAADLTLAGSPALALDWVPTATGDQFGGVYTIAAYSGTQTGTFATPTLTANSGAVDGSAYVESISHGGGTNDAVTVTLKDLVDGDADLTGKVDSDDASVLNLNWLVDTNMTWFTGDADFSGKVDSDDASILNLNWLVEADIPAAGSATATYDAATGQVLISGKDVSQVGIVSDGNLLGNIGGVNWLNGFTLQEDTRPWRVIETLSGANIPGPSFTGEWDNHPFFTATAGIPQGEFDLQVRYQVVNGDVILAPVDYVPVPEPGTLVLLGVGALGLLLWRRR